jgi:hypothetical protein
MKVLRVIVTPFLFLPRPLFYRLYRTCDAQRTVYYGSVIRHLCVPAPNARAATDWRRFPTTHLLQVAQWRAVLAQPAGPSVPQVVAPAEIRHAGPLQRIARPSCSST